MTKKWFTYRQGGKISEAHMSPCFIYLFWGIRRRRMKCFTINLDNAQYICLAWRVYRLYGGSLLAAHESVFKFSQRRPRIWSVRTASILIFTWLVGGTPVCKPHGWICMGENAVMVLIYHISLLWSWQWRCGSSVG